LPDERNREQIYECNCYMIIDKLKSPVTVHIKKIKKLFSVNPVYFFQYQGTGMSPVPIQFKRYGGHPCRPKL